MTDDEAVDVLADCSAWSRAALEARGFRGFEPLLALSSGEVPREPGVYIVYRPKATEPPTFLPRSPAGHFKGQDPTAPIATLEREWVPDAEVLYIGKAGPGSPHRRRGLRKRLDEYRQFGLGAPVGHRGGRYIWQLEDAPALLAAWMTTPADSYGEVERELVAEFRADHGARPFANLTDAG